MSTVLKGVVDWTGDNPFIYLKRNPDEEWSALCLYFRIVASPHGRGQTMIILENPYVIEDAEASRLCFTNNEGLSCFLIDEFVRKFGLFRKAGALDGLTIIADAEFTTESDYPRLVQEKVSSSGGSALLSWEGLGEPFAVDVPPDQSQTGRHQMLSIFQTVKSAWVGVNGRRVSGATVERQFFDRRAQSAALAHSETWIR